VAESSEKVNRRQSQRFSCTGAAEISQQGSRWGWGRVNDLSTIVCYIEIVHLLPVGSDAQLRLTIADISVDLAAKVVSNDLGIGMGMEFVAATPEQLNKLAQIVSRVSTTESPTARQTENSPPGPTPVRITREAAPVILAKIVKRINENGVLTRQDLLEIVRSTD